ncbi:MAG TPA: hypothetical protein VKD69_14400, partial [Vicinamibacterales bacterium]|nr:hypothetical protein [Vicinamibacterales bacterium]
MKTALVALVACAGAGAAAALAISAEQRAATRSTLSIEQLIDIRHPSNPMWSPDGRRIVFVWDRAGVSKVYVADAAAAAPPRELAAAGPQLNGAFWSADGAALMVPKDGDLWRVPVDGGAGSAVWTTAVVESNIVPSPDGARVAFVRSGAGAAPASTGARGGRGGVGGELVVRSLADGREIVVARADQHPIGGLSWSPDGRT